MNIASREDHQEVIYREVLGWGMFYFVWILMGGFLLALFVYLLIEGQAGGAVGLGLGLVVVVALYITMRKLVFEITVDYVYIRFGLIHKKIERARIRSCEPFKLTFLNYLGMGVRIGFDGTIAYNTRLGRGVRIEADGVKRPIVVSVNEPERVCEILSAQKRAGERR